MARRVEVVVDSSVAVKWFSPETKSDKALELLDSHTQGTVMLWASWILYYEVANALRYKSDYDVEKLTKAIGSLLRLHLETSSRETELLARAGEIACDCGISIYDSIAVALAESRATTCLTADESQYRKLRPKGYPIELL